MRKILSVVTLLVVISGCGVKFKQLSLSDKPLDTDVSGGTYTPTYADRGVTPEDEQAGLASSKSVPSILFTDSLPNGWGIEKQGTCKDFSFDEDVKFQGKKSLHLKWNKGGCLWVGMGLSWNNWEAIDYSNQLNTLALSMYIKNNGAVQPTIPMIIGIEDYAEKGAYTAISTRHLQGEKKIMDTNWVRVLVPLTDFQFEANNTNAANIKQMKFSFEGTGDINIDRIEMVSISGAPAQNTPNTPAITQNTPKQTTQQVGNFKQTVYANLFQDVLPTGAWGLDKDNCKEVAVVSTDKYEGTNSLLYKWNKTDACGWIGFGFSWTNWAPADISRYEKKGALCFRLKNLAKPNDGLPLVIGFEDYTGKGAYLALDNRFITTDEYTDNWNDVIVPLSLFEFEDHQVNAGTIKQLILQGEGSANLLIDDMKLATYPGTPSNPHAKPDISMEVVPMLSENSPSTDGVFVGIFTPGQPPAIMNTFGKLTGKKPAAVMWYENWTAKARLEEINRIHAQGCIPHIVWEANNGGGKGNTINLSTIIKGEQDAYIKAYAQACAKAKGPIHLRIFHEFNGNWYPWSTALNGKDPQKHIDAWRHIVEIFRKQGATNVEFIWCPNNGGVPNERDNPWNDPYKCYPGSEWVDWVSIDGYNWGDNDLPGIGSHWAPFREIFESHYLKLARNFPDKPIMIGEFASNQAGGNKAEWFRNMQKDLKDLFPRIKSYNYFHINKETDWRVNSNPLTEAAFREIMQEPYSRSSAEGLAKVTKNFLKEFPDTSDLQRTIQRMPAAQKRDEAIAMEQAKLSAARKKTIRVAPANETTQADGVLNDGEYNGEPMIIEKSEIYLSYDNQYFYVAAKIEDTDPLQNKNEDANIWNGDAIELAIGFDPEASMERAEYLGTDFHIGLKATDKPYVWNWSRNRKTSNTTVVTKKTDNGYVIEAKIPLIEFEITKFPAGKKISGEAAIDNGDNNARRSQRLWNASKGGFNERPFMWGFFEINN